MPTATALRCDICEKEQSLDNPFMPDRQVCLKCFDRYLNRCPDCGAPLRRPRIEMSTLADNNLRIYNAIREYHPGHTHNGERYCGRCIDNIRYADDPHYWHPTPLNVTFATYNEIQSTRKFGVEVETADCYGHRELYGKTPFGCKGDPTINGREFDSPVLYGDQGLGAIREFLSYGEDEEWRADDYCGCHTHYDMRDEDDESLYRIAYAYRKMAHVFGMFVPLYRRTNSYCRVPQWPTTRLREAHSRGTDFESFASGSGLNRYEVCNLWAYSRHGTFEVRLLEGTVDSETICNWIILNCRFMDVVKHLTLDQIDELSVTDDLILENIFNMVGEGSLGTWLKKRFEDFN